MQNIKIILVFICLLMGLSLKAQPLQPSYNSYRLNQDFAGLQVSRPLTIESVIQSKINELIELGTYFKYSTELKNNLYKIEIKNETVLLYVLKNNSKNINSKENKVPVKNFKEILEFKINKVENSFFLDFVDYKKYINEKDYLQMLNAQRSSPFDVNFIIKDKIIIDKEILNFSLSNSEWPNYGKTLNRNQTKSHLVTINNQPCELFNDATAACIVPLLSYSGYYGEGVSAKTFTVDKNWNRIIVYDKDLYQGGNGRIATSFPENNQNFFSHPTDITCGTKYSANNPRDTIYPLYVADFGNNRIMRVDYRSDYFYDPGLNIWLLWNSYFVANSVLASNLNNPYSLAFHTGVNKHSRLDDVLWFTQGPSTNRYLSCISVDNRGDQSIQSLGNINYAGVNYNLSVGRFSIYRSPDGQRNVMAIIDENSNTLFVLKMTASGLLDINAPRFIVGAFKFNYQKLKSVALSSNNNGIDGTTIWAVADIGPGGCFPGSQHCGCLSTLKISYLNNIPTNTEYLASTWRGLGSDKSFADLQNLHLQSGYLDLFTMERWDNDYGVRRFKPGIDILSEQTSSQYCLNTGYTLNIRLTNPAKVHFSAYYKPDGLNQVYGTVYINDVKGTVYSFDDNAHHLKSGYNNITIKANVPSTAVTTNPRDEQGPMFKLMVQVIPEDENDWGLNNSHKIVRSYEGVGINPCNSSGGCPFVYVNDGEDFRQDNNILHRSEFTENVGNDILDKYKLNVYPANMNGLFELKIKELNEDYNFFDNFNLKAYDHPVGTELAITENNDVVLFFPSFVDSPANADIDETDVTSDVFFDSAYTKTAFGDENSELIATFENPEPRSKTISNVRNAYLTCLKTVMGNVSKLKKSGKNVKLKDNTFADSTALILDPSALDGYIHLISQKSDVAKLTAYDDQLNYISEEKTIARRENRSMVIVPVGQGLSIDSATADWNRDFEITFFAATDVFYGGYIEYALELVEAENSVNGNVLEELNSINGRYAEMDSTSEITIRFSNDLPEVEEGFIRDFVLETTGRYEAGGSANRTSSMIQSQNNNIPKDYKLYQNFPNPFNPATTIKYDIPKDGFVSIKIYDILGKEVYNFGENKKAGYYEMQFNGANLSSGIYFYRVQSNNFVNTKRMVLVK